MGGYQIIAVNTLLYDADYTCIENKEQMLRDQYDFIKATLKAAKRDKKKVLIVGHMPPGFGELKNTLNFDTRVHNDEYLKLFQNYGNMI